MIRDLHPEDSIYVVVWPPTDWEPAPAPEPAPRRRPIGSEMARHRSLVLRALTVAPMTLRELAAKTKLRHSQIRHAVSWLTAQGSITSVRPSPRGHAIYARSGA